MNFSTQEKRFLNEMEECRLATAHDNIPHVKPVSYILDSDTVLVATDYETRTCKNLKKNDKVAAVIDRYKTGCHKAICIQGEVEIIENGPEFQNIYKKFFERFSWVRNEPWKENEAPFLRIIPKTKVSWGLND